MHAIGGWRGSRWLLGMVAATLALPLLFGTGARATWDWSFLFCTLGFVVFPALCVAHVIVTTLTAYQLAGRARAIELASLMVPCGALVGLYAALGGFS